MLLLELKKYQINLLYDIYSKIIEEKYKTYNSIRKLYIMPISKNINYIIMIVLIKYFAIWKL